MLGESRANASGVAKENFESNERRMPHALLQRESVLTRLYTAKSERTSEISVDGSDGCGDQGAQVVDVLYNIVDGLLCLHGSPALGTRACTVAWTNRQSAPVYLI